MDIAKLREIYKDFPRLTDEQQQKINELIDKGWFDVYEAYSKYCEKNNLAWYILDNSKIEKFRKFKEGTKDGLTKEQREKIKKLKKMGYHDVIKVYEKACEEENYTDERKAYIALNLVGVYFGLDDD